MKLFFQRWQGMLLLCALFAFIPLAPVLSGLYLFQESTALSFSYPLFAHYSLTHFLTGEVFWNALNFNGFPDFIVMGASLNPFTILFNILLPAFAAVHWFTYMNIVLGAFFCSLYLRRIGCSAYAATMGGVAYVTANWWLVPLTYFVPVLPMLPLAAWNLLDSREHPVRAAILGSILCGYVWLSVTLQVALMVFSVIGIGSIVFALEQWPKSWKAFLHPLLNVTVIFTIGTLIGLPKFLPSWIYGLLSWREHGLTPPSITIEGLTFLSPIRYFFPYVDFPFLNFGNGLVGIYLGAAGFILLLFTALHFRRPMRLWILAYLFLWVLAMNHSPVAAIIHSIPPFSYFRGAGRWTIVGNFVAGVLVAYGFDLLIRGEVEILRKRTARILRWFLLLVFCSMLFGQLLLIFFPENIISFFQNYFEYFRQVLHLAATPEYLSSFVQKRIGELQTMPLILRSRFLLPFFSLLIFTLIIQTRLWQTWKNRGLLLLLATLLTTSLTLTLRTPLIAASAFAPSTPISSFLSSATPGNAMGFLTVQSEEEFLNTFHPSVTDQQQWNAAFLQPNLNLFLNLPVLDYFDNLTSRRPSRLVGWLGGQWVTGTAETRLADARGSLKEKMALFVERTDIASIAGLRYLVSALSPSSTSWKKVFESSVTSHNIPVGIYENASVRPFAYFADSVVTAPQNETDAFSTLTSQKWPNKRTLLECEPACGTASGDGKGTVSVQERNAAHVVLSTSSKKPQWLVVTINRLPGWTVEVDGLPYGSVFANTAYFGIPLEKGNHEIILTFSLSSLLRSALPWISQDDGPEQVAILPRANAEMER